MKKFRTSLTLSTVLAASLLCVSPTVSHAINLTDSHLRTYQKFTVGSATERDAVRPIDRPAFVSAEDAALFLESDEQVFLEEPAVTGREALVYPLRVLARHEVVNLEQDGVLRSLTFCPLTGSLACFVGELDGTPFSLGTTGMLVSSNRVLYDRATGSKWSQILGQALGGQLKGKTLRRSPVIWTTWDKARAAYPNLRVLARPRSGTAPSKYGHNPYGEYKDLQSYFRNNALFFPPMHIDERFPLKEHIIGATDADAALAVSYSAMLKQKAISIDVGLSTIAALYDSRLGAVRLFSAVLEGQTLHFTASNGRIIDRETHSVWDPYGKAISGPLHSSQLRRLPETHSMWFAWKAFHPFTAYWNGKLHFPLPQ
ncbi:DUF3179 domain-containing protein [Desulfobaculum bizertense]|uniref:DUF3179 domain-containing protein n=1 Tax=Desulfobaculum bizertense DSM 18034 TaxID=1121442 RepID=A0A1T4VDV6_9BACT|nr:DUF3179 domain-containing protein [Desulfobaculum bizertense]SKA63107.1 Protein of unknown function [Desulfobaculum bizertense DSM 18034]